MVNFIPNNLLGLLLQAGIDLDTDTLKWIFCGGSFDGMDEDDQLADITVLDEFSGTGYTGGHGGAGRKTLTGVVVTVVDPSNRADIDTDAKTWTAIDGDTIEWVGIHKEGAADDTTADVVGFFDVATQIANGGDITITPDAAGFMRMSRAGGS